MCHEEICHSVTFLSHVHVIAKLFDGRLQHLCQPCAVFCEIICNVCYCPIIIIHWRNIDVGVPVYYPFTVVIIYKYFVYITPKKNFASFSGLLAYSHLIPIIGNGFICSFRCFFENSFDPFHDVFLILFFAFHFDIPDCTAVASGFLFKRLSNILAVAVGLLGPFSRSLQL